MKKLLVKLSVLFLVIGLLSSCSKDNDPLEEGNVITRNVTVEELESKIWYHQELNYSLKFKDKIVKCYSHENFVVEFYYEIENTNLVLVDNNNYKIGICFEKNINTGLEQLKIYGWDFKIKSGYYINKL